MAGDVGISVEGMATGDTVLVVGPPMTGKYDLFLQLLAPAGDRFILISTRNGADRILADFRAVAGDVPEDRIGIVDCVSRHGDAEDDEGRPLIKYTNSPRNLTAIGVRFTELFSAFRESAEQAPTAVGLHSLSQLVMHADVKKVYQFLQVLTGQVRSAGWTGVGVIDSGSVDEAEIQMLKHHFDGVVETQENDAGEREFRSRGFTPSASAWQRF